MKHFIRITIWTLLTVYISLFVLLRLSVVQTVIADNVSKALGEELDTKVTVGCVDIRLPNRIIVDDVVIYDQQHRRMLRVGRLSATIILLDLFDKKITISAAQLFGTQASLYRKNSQEPLNCQFVIDALSKKDTTKTTPLDLSIASLIIRNGNLSYHQYDEPVAKERFSPYHINISKISGHIIINRITDSSARISLKRISMAESSGLKLNNLTADITADKSGIHLEDMAIKMPRTHIVIPEANVSYSLTPDGDIQKGSLKFKTQLTAKKFSLKDLAALMPSDIVNAIPSITFSASAEGTDTNATGTLNAHSVKDDDIALQMSATVRDFLAQPKYNILISKCFLSGRSTKAVASLLNMPETVCNIGGVDVKGRISKEEREHYVMNADISPLEIGRVTVNGVYKNGNITANVNTKSANIGRIVRNFGNVACDIDIDARTDESMNIMAGRAKGTVREITYNNYTYRNLNMDVAYANKTVSGQFDIHDPNVSLDICGKADMGRIKRLNADISLKDFCPKALNLTNRFGDDRFALKMTTDISGTDINDIYGTLTAEDVSVTSNDTAKADAFVDYLSINAERQENNITDLSLSSDFANIRVSGLFSIKTIAGSLTNLIAKHLPAIPGMAYTKPNSNNFRIDATIYNIDFIKRLINIPINIGKPLTLNGFVNSADNSSDIKLAAPKLNAGGMSLENTSLRFWAMENGVQTTISTLLNGKKGDMALNLNCHGQDNNLYSTLTWDNMRDKIFRGQLNTTTFFSVGATGLHDINVSIPHSTFEVGDTLWNIRSRGINYETERLIIDHLAIENDNQHLYINGVASKSPSDTITAELKDINIGYILNLINFHSVSFDGQASGKAMAHGVMREPAANAQLSIRDFCFENGNLGTMQLNADYNHGEGQINVDGVVTPTDRDSSRLIVNGNISPRRNTIDLGFDIKDTPLRFMPSFCGSFMHDIDLYGSGALRLHGPLNAINLEGKVVTEGCMTLTSTNCRYSIARDTITFVPDDILFKNVHLQDKYGNTATVSGGIHHRHLGRISYDLKTETKRFLVYDFQTMGEEDTYCGYAIIDGTIGIHGRGNEVNISAECTPQEETFFTYNASSPETIKSQDFITWGSARQDLVKEDGTNADSMAVTDNIPLNSGNNRANIRLNFILNVTPAARLHLIMDEETGDYVNLFGSGSLRVQFYNKGGLDIFGNYIVDHGTYKMTIQSLMRRDLAFQKGGLIAFGGNPYNATLNLQAAYLLNSVSLADLNIGSSFKSNNVPVNCLMNITGTPGTPKVNFGLNLPSLSSAARQMVYSVINSKEEMNQQVLYLLAIGRFYSQANDTENTQRTKQSTLAVQSFLSGTLSQQLNNILGEVTGNSNWSIGANITPGADGFNNAVYEGLLSGRMFNNRLLFNGQFGYRDNINTNTQNFIGDFTIQYLLTPNGNLSLKMYNQSNDRYFTRSSLNTQGIGVVIQKEFGK